MSAVSLERQFECQKEVQQEAKLLMTDREYWQCLGIFLLTGTAALYYWNSVLNTLYSVVGVRFPDYPHLADTVTAAYSTVSFLTAVTMSWIGPLRKWYTIVGGLMLAVMTVLFPVATLNLSGKAGVAVLHLTAIVAGIAETAFQVSGFAFAVILPYNYGGWISFGYGICGVVTFAFWMLFSQGIFDINGGSERQVAAAVWCHMAIAGCVVLVAVAAFSWFFVKSSVGKQVLAQINEKPVDQDTEVPYDLLENEDEAHKKGSVKTSLKQYYAVFRQTWGMQCGLAFAIGLSMMAYPLIGPYRWNRSYKENDILTGVFQIGDFAGRYIPNLSWLLPWLLLPRWVVVSLTIARVILLALFIWIAKSTEAGHNGILQQYAVQVVLMLALSLSNGWYASVYMTRIPEGCTDAKSRARASSMAVSLLVLAIAVGLWLAKLV